MDIEGLLARLMGLVMFIFGVLIIVAFGENWYGAGLIILSLVIAFPDLIGAWLDEKH